MILLISLDSLIRLILQILQTSQILQIFFIFLILLIFMILLILICVSNRIYAHVYCFTALSFTSFATKRATVDETERQKEEVSREWRSGDEEGQSRRFSGIYNSRGARYDPCPSETYKWHLGGVVEAKVAHPLPTSLTFLFFSFAAFSLTHTYTP